VNQHAKNLRSIASHIRSGRTFAELFACHLLDAADYIEAHEDLANECRRKVEVQIALRVEAQARAGRLAREARR
jgi:hypothetical protein